MLDPGPPFSAAMLDWYDRFRRDLPWRVAPGSHPDARPPAYHVLVSELMLQQTQVATVVPYFRRFLDRFPTIESLAAADEQDVLRLWQGLGYYSRARNLQKAARAVVKEFAGRVPSTVDALLTLPGVGRYTAGALASLAFDTAAPILDGNVARVLCRLDAIDADPREPRTAALLWARAEAVLPAARVGDFNSALMELGATVCTPRSPKCLHCPVQRHCAALAAGMQERIPPPRKAKPIPLLERWTFCVRRPGQGDDADGWLIEQRPPTGRWAGLWQFVTVPAGDEPPTARDARAACGLPVSRLRPLGEVTHGLTHRQYRFDVFAADLRDGEHAGAKAEATSPRRWSTLDDLNELPMSRPHLKIVQMLRDGESATR